MIMEREKLAKTAVVIDRILKIVQGFLVAGVIVSAVFIPLSAILGEKIIADASSLTLGNVTLKLTGDARAYLDTAGIKASIIVMLVSSILVLAMVWYFLKKLREILVPMKEGRPFESGIASRIRSLAWTVLIGGGIGEIGRAVGAVFELKAYDLSALMDHPAVESVMYNYSIRLWFVAVALVLFFLSYVFRYGEDLQRESDETL